VYQGGRFNDPHAIDEGPVAAANVLDQEAITIANNAGMRSRDCVRVDLDVADWIPSDHRFVSRQIMNRRLADILNHDVWHENGAKNWDTSNGIIHAKSSGIRPQ
jgi:hypothetical protein